MCRTCGCADGIEHAHGHRDDGTITVSLERRLLERNEGIARATRAALGARGIFTLNLMSAPGSGKTTLLERMLHDLGDELPIAVVEGDQATEHDADRIRAAGGRAVQINTGAGCHLDAAMVERALRRLDPPAGALLVIENVGNLVCPALFDVGENARVVLTAVTDGEDKPLKYPHMFRSADAVLVTKVDLLPFVRFDRGRCLAYARQARPGVETFEVSAARGDGLEGWYAWLRRRVASARTGSVP